MNYKADQSQRSVDFLQKYNVPSHGLWTIFGSLCALHLQLWLEWHFRLPVGSVCPRVPAVVSVYSSDEHCSTPPRETGVAHLWRRMSFSDYRRLRAITFKWITLACACLLTCSITAPKMFTWWLLMYLQHKVKLCWAETRVTMLPGLSKLKHSCRDGISE